MLSIVQADNYKYRIAMVGYLNTQPFSWSFVNIPNDQVELKLGNPAACARMLEDDLVDIALIPVGAITNLDDYNIITDFCIGCDDYVRTVILFSDSKKEEWNKIYLDNHSRTSQLLAKVLVHEYLKLEVEFEVCDIEEKLKDENDKKAAYLMIGDKVFANEGKFLYKFDLGHLWKKYTSLPFVFAVWVSKKENKIDPAFTKLLNDSFNIIIGDLENSLQERSAIYNGVDLTMYFRKNISYQLDKSKMMALRMFMEKTQSWRNSNLPVL